MEIISADFWVAVMQIIAIDILLGGDNAVIIAMACRNLSDEQRKKGIIWGTVGAVVLRLGLIFFALRLLALPFLKLAGAALLLWIGVRLLYPEANEAKHAAVATGAGLLAAVKTIVVADVVMSLDNVLAIAGAADGNIVLVVFGIVVAIPIIVWGSQLVLRLIDRFPVVITMGGALLGWIAGTMAIGDGAVAPYVAGLPKWLYYLAGTAGAVVVVAVGEALSWLRQSDPMVEKAPGASR